MNNLEKRTKAELLDTIRNLSSTIDARNKTLDMLKESHNVEINRLKNMVKEKDNDIAKWKEYSDSKSNTHGKELLKEVEFYKNAYEKRTAQLNMYYTQHGNLLKILSGTINMALELNENMEKEVK